MQRQLSNLISQQLSGQSPPGSWFPDFPAAGLLGGLFMAWLVTRQLLIWFLQRRQREQAAGGATAGRSNISGRQAGASNLGRIAICAALAGREDSAERLQGYFRQLLTRYTALQEGALTGLLLVYPTSTLVLLEGDNTVLLSLTRELAGDLEDKRIGRARVVSFVWDAEERLFGSFLSAYIAPQQHEPTPASKTLAPEKWMLTVQELDRFAKGVGPKLAALKQGAQQKALQELRAFSPTPLPPQSDLLSLAGSETGPSLPDFLTAFDLEYERFKTLVQQGATSGTDMVRLTKLYGAHLLKEQRLQQQAQDPAGAVGAFEGSLAKYLPKPKGGRSSHNSRTGNAAA